MGPDTGQAHHLHMQHLASIAKRLQIGARIIPQAKLHRITLNRFGDGLVVTIKLVADRSAYKIAAVGIEAVLNQ